MKKLLAIFFVMIPMTSVHAYKYVIFTDQPDGKKAKEVAELIKTTYPFNKLDVQVEVVKIPASRLDCKSNTRDNKGKVIERLVTCDGTEDIQRETAMKGADQAMIVKDLNYHGGSSYTGGIPVMSSASSPRVMLHEYMHTLGLCDEYEYDADEADRICQEIEATPNSVVIEPLRGGYGGDADARAKHGSAIPWYDDILAKTPITNGKNLGTGKVNFNQLSAPNNTKTPAALEEPIGLYQGKVCAQASKNKVTWHPGGRANIMENHEAGLGAPIEMAVERILTSKGTSRTLDAEMYEPKKKTKDIYVHQPDIAHSNDTVVNDSGRNLFKDFFQWIMGLFQAIGNSLGI